MAHWSDPPLNIAHILKVVTQVKHAALAEHHVIVEFLTLKSVRAKMPNLPIIFLSSKAEEQDQIIGFTLGADDYITKPFSKHLLLFRVAAVLRRHSVGAVTNLDAPVRAGQLTIDQDRHLVTWATMAVDLTVTECLLLLAMAQRPGVVKTRNQLMDAAYREAIYVSDRCLPAMPTAISIWPNPYACIQISRHCKI